MAAAFTVAASDLVMPGLLIFHTTDVRAVLRYRRSYEWLPRSPRSRYPRYAFATFRK